MIKNDYEIRGDITILFLNRKKGDRIETIIDTKNLVKIDKWNLFWHAQWDKKLESFYVTCVEYIGKIDGADKKYKTKIHCLHSKILNSSNKSHVDHLNHNTLDNREINLIEKTPKNNLVNRNGPNRNSTTGERNVSWAESIKRYLVQFQVNGKNTIFGRFDKDHFEDAVRLARQKRFEIYGVE